MTLIFNGDSFILEPRKQERVNVPMNDVVQEVLLSLRKHPDFPKIFLSNHRELFARILKRAKINDICFHTRHTAASHLAMVGVDILTISRILSHSNLKMTDALRSFES